MRPDLGHWRRLPCTGRRLPRLVARRAFPASRPPSMQLRRDMAPAAPGTASTALPSPLVLGAIAMLRPCVGSVWRGVKPHMRHRNLNTRLVHLALEPRVKSARHAPLLQRPRLDLPFHNHPVSLKAVEPPHFDGRKYFVAQAKVPLQIGAHFHNHACDFIELNGERHPYLEHRVCEVARQVLHDLDLREGNGVNRALSVT